MTHEEAIKLINNSKNFDDSLKGFLYLADKEHNTNAMMALANNYYNNKEIDKAISYYKKASDFHNPLGFTMLGFIYYYGRGVDKNYELAFKYFTKASLDHEYHAMLKLSDMYLNGYFVNQNYHYAYDYLEPLFNEGMIKFLKNEYKDNPLFDVSMRFGHLYKEGLYVKKNLEEALKYYVLAYNGFIKQIEFDKFESYNKLKFCLSKIEELKKEINKDFYIRYDLLDFIFDKNFKFDYRYENDNVDLIFKFLNKELFIYPQVNKVFLLDEIVLKFGNVSDFNKIEYEEIRPIDYQFKGRTLRLYDEDSTVMHFDFDSFNSSIEIKPDFYDLLGYLNKGNVLLKYKDHEENIVVNKDNTIVYNNKTFKNIDDFMLNNKELKDKFNSVEKIISNF